MTRIHQAKDGQLYTSESEMQQACVRLFRLMWPKYAGLLFSIPNGAHTSDANRKRLSAEGMLPGAADLFFALPKSGRNGLFLEAKSPVGKQSPAQKEFQQAVITAGYVYIIFHSTEEFERAIRWYLTETHG